MQPQNTFKQVPRPIPTETMTSMSKYRKFTALMCLATFLITFLFVKAISSSPKPTDRAMVSFPDNTVQVIRLDNAHEYREGNHLVLDDYDGQVTFIRAVYPQPVEPVK